MLVLGTGLSNTSFTPTQYCTNNIEIALKTIDRGLEVDNRNSILYQLKADISAQNDELKSALELYLKAIEFESIFSMHFLALLNSHAAIIYSLKRILNIAQSR